MSRLLILLRKYLHFNSFRDSIVVSISACHADDPGSIPGRGVLLSHRKEPKSVRFQYSDAGTRTRVAWVKARYPNQLDYIGHWLYVFQRHNNNTINITILRGD